MPYTPGLRYLAAALALGLIAVWGSENFFWSAPQPGLSALDLALTWAAYAVCAAAALSAVLITGIAGWKALFLGGALLGWLTEGVIVSTAYDNFPINLVWTGLSWHALITSLSILGLCRAGVHWPVGRQIAALVALGLGGAYFAQFWPLERGTMPGFGPVLFYIAGLGLVVPLANLVLDRIAQLALPPPWVLAIAPLCLLLLGILQAAYHPDPRRLSIPVLLGLTVWIMQRLGSGRSALAFGAPAPVWRHALFLLAALIVPLLAVPGWHLLQGYPANWPVLVISSVLSLGLWLWLLVQAFRRKSAQTQPATR